MQSLVTSPNSRRVSSSKTQLSESELWVECEALKTNFEKHRNGEEHFLVLRKDG